MPTLLGTGVCTLTFRLLSDVRNPNYITVDRGERHVFEVTRTDGSGAHVHFHRSGKCDKPRFFKKIAIEIGAGEPDLGNARMELDRPAPHVDIVQSETPGKNLSLGRNEAAIAFESLLHALHGRRPIQDMNNTDEIAFSGRRLLRNTVNNREIIGEGISGIIAVKALDDDIPKLLFLASRFELHPYVF